MLLRRQPILLLQMLVKTGVGRPMYVYPRERTEKNMQTIKMQRHLYACRVKRMQKEIKPYIFYDDLVRGMRAFASFA